ncbi:DUF6384 family protein [Aeoliella sp. SH292]|uniref:DUF6384 family protein n=1 Tax=Aeoliella sp. SH292 TaxID=3454464 RepID=UPI003F9876DF
MSRSASQQATTPELDPAIVAADQKLTLAEMTRVMDVARTLRKERSVAERELNREETIAMLRLKLREAADLAGDPVTDAEIEVAIKHYFANLHEFDPPEPGVETFVAGVYVRRYEIVGWTMAIAAAALLTWGWWFSGMMPGERRKELRSQQVYSQVEEVTSSIEALTTNPETASAAEAARAEAATYRDRHDVSALEQLRDRLLNQESVLKDEYRLMIVTDGQTGVDRYSEDTGGLSGYYVIVEAVDSKGNTVPMKVRNAESGNHEQVNKWAEQVPQDVYERVKADKEADGIVDAREFAVKRRGETDVEVTLPGAGGAKLERGRQITTW